MSEPIDNTTDAIPSCLPRVSRKEFLQKVLNKATGAGTLLSVVAVKEIVIHPTLAALASATVAS